jgi:hypothetical protein
MNIQLFALDETFNNSPYPIMGTLAIPLSKNDHIILHQHVKLGYLDTKYHGFDDLN